MAGHRGPMIPVHRYVYVDPLWLDARDEPQQPLKKKPLKEARRHVIRSPPPSREGGSRGGMSIGGLTVGGLPRVDKRRPPALPTEMEHGGDRRQYSYLLLHSNVAEDIMNGGMPLKYSTLWSKQDRRPRDKVRPLKGNRSTGSLNLGMSMESDGSDKEDLSKALLIKGSTSDGQYDPSGSRFMSFHDDAGLPPISSAKRKPVGAPMRSSDDWPELPPGFSHSFSQGPAPALSVERNSAGSQFDSTHIAYSPRLPTSVFSPGSTGNSWRAGNNRPPAEWNEQLLRIMPISEWEVKPRKRQEVQASLHSSYMSSSGMSGGQSIDEFDRDPLDPFPFTSFSMEGPGMAREQRSFSFVESPQLRRCRTAPDVTAAARLADPGLSMEDARDDLHVRRMSLTRRGAEGNQRQGSRRRKRSKRRLKEFGEDEVIPPGPRSISGEHSSVRQPDVLNSAIMAGWDRRSASSSKPSVDPKQRASEQSLGRRSGSLMRASVPASEGQESSGHDSFIVEQEEEGASGSASHHTQGFHSDGRKSSSSASGPHRGSQIHLEDGGESSLRGSRTSFRSAGSVGTSAAPGEGAATASSSAAGAASGVPAGGGGGGGASFGPPPIITVNTVGPEAEAGASKAVQEGAAEAVRGTDSHTLAAAAANPEQRAASKRGGGDLALMQRKARGSKQHPQAEWAADVGGKGLDLRQMPSPAPDAEGDKADEGDGGEGGTVLSPKSHRPMRLTTEATEDARFSPRSKDATPRDVLDEMSESLDPARRAERRMRDRSKQIERSRSHQMYDGLTSPRAEDEQKRPDATPKNEAEDEAESELLNKLLAKQKQREQAQEEKQKEKAKEEMMKRRKSKRAMVGGVDPELSVDTSDGKADGQDDEGKAARPLREESSMSQLSHEFSKILEEAEEEESCLGDDVHDSPVSSLSTIDEPPLFKAIMKGRDPKPSELMLPGHRLESMGHVPVAAHHHKHGPQVAGEESSGSSTPTTVELWDEAGHLLFWDVTDPNRLAGRFRDAMSQVWTETPEPQTPESEREAREWDQLLALPAPRSEELWRKVRKRLPEVALQGMLRNVSKEPAEEQSQHIVTETLHEVYSKMNVKRYMTKMEGRTKAEVELLLQKQPGGPAGVWPGRLTSCKRQLGTLHVFTKGHRAAIRA